MKNYTKILMMFVVNFMLLQVSFAQTKPNVIVLDFKSLRGFDEFESSLITEDFVKALSKKRNCKIIPSNDLNDYPTLDSNCEGLGCAVEIGKKIGAKYVIFGGVGRFGPKRFQYRISVIDTESEDINSVHNKVINGTKLDFGNQLIKLAESINFDSEQKKVPEPIIKTPPVIVENSDINIQKEKKIDKEEAKLENQEDDHQERIDQKEKVIVEETGSSKKWWYIGGGAIAATTAAVIWLTGGSSTTSVGNPPGFPTSSSN